MGVLVNFSCWLLVVGSQLSELPHFEDFISDNREQTTAPLPYRTAVRINDLSGQIACIGTH